MAGAADKEQHRFVQLDQKKINNLREIAGYAALVYSPPSGYEAVSKDTNSLELIAQKGYKQLVQIEDCFRTAKTNLKLRPVFLHRNDRIKGHCVVCILSLIILKAIQYNLAQQGIKMSFTKIQQALNQAMVAVLTSAFNTGKVLYLNSFMPWVDIAADHKRGSHRSPSQSPVGSATALIVQAVGLKPLKAV